MLIITFCGQKIYQSNLAVIFMVEKCFNFIRILLWNGARVSFVFFSALMVKNRNWWYLHLAKLVPQLSKSGSRFVHVFELKYYSANSFALNATWGLSILMGSMTFLYSLSFNNLTKYLRPSNLRKLNCLSLKQIKKITQ